MAKALIFADAHVHDHKNNTFRLQDCVKALDWVFEVAVAKRVDHLIFLGDLLHERSKIDVLNYLRTFEVFMRHMAVATFRTWLLIGNHDMYHKERWDVNSVKPFTAIRNVEIIDEPSTVTIGGVKVDFCPHTENPLRELKKLKEGRPKGDFRLLFGHMAVHGATLNKLYGTQADVIVEYDNDMVPVSPDVFDDWDRVFLGHYHSPQKLNDKVEYVGSPLQLSFGEAFDEKHVVVLDLDTLETEYVRNSFSPKHFVLTPDQLGHHDLTGNFVRVLVDDMHSKDMSDLRREISPKVASLDFKQREKRTEDDLTIVSETKALLSDEDELLKAYVKDRKPSLDVDKLMATVNRIRSAVKS